MKLLLVHFVLIASGLALLTTDESASIKANKPEAIVPQTLSQQPLKSDSQVISNLKSTEASPVEKDRVLHQIRIRRRRLDGEETVIVNPNNGQEYVEIVAPGQQTNGQRSEETQPTEEIQYVQQESTSGPTVENQPEYTNSNGPSDYVEQKTQEVFEESQPSGGNGEPQIVDEYVEQNTNNSHTTDQGLDETYEDTTESSGSVEEGPAEYIDEAQPGDGEEVVEEIVEDEYPEEQGNEEEYVEEEQGGEDEGQAEEEVYEDDQDTEDFNPGNESEIGKILSILKASRSDDGYHLSLNLGDALINFLETIKSAEAQLSIDGASEEGNYSEYSNDESENIEYESPDDYSNPEEEEYNEDEETYNNLAEEEDGEYDPNYDNSEVYEDENANEDEHSHEDHSEYEEAEEERRRKRRIRIRRHMQVRPVRNLRSPNNVHYRRVVRVPLRHAPVMRRRHLAHYRPVQPLVKHRIFRRLNRFNKQAHNKLLRHLNSDDELVGNITRISKFIGVIDKVNATYTNAFTLLPEPAITNGLSESDKIASEMATFAKVRGFGVFFLKNYGSLREDLEYLQSRFSGMKATIDDMLYNLNRNKNYSSLLSTKEAASTEFIKRQELLSKLSQEYALKMYEASQMVEFLMTTNSNIANQVSPLTHQPDPSNGDCVVSAQTLSSINVLLPYLNSNKNSIQVTVNDIRSRLDSVEGITTKVDEVLGNMQLIVEGRSVEAESFTKQAGIWTFTWALAALLISMVF